MHIRYTLELCFMCTSAVTRWDPQCLTGSLFVVVEFSIHDIRPVNHDVSWTWFEEFTKNLTIILKLQSIFIMVVLLVAIVSDSAYRAKEHEKGRDWSNYGIHYNVLRVHHICMKVIYWTWQATSEYFYFHLSVDSPLQYNRTLASFRLSIGFWRVGFHISLSKILVVKLYIHVNWHRPYIIVRYRSLPVPIPVAVTMIDIRNTISFHKRQIMVHWSMRHLNWPNWQGSPLLILHVPNEFGYTNWIHVGERLWIIHSRSRTSDMCLVL